ncbi:hypothetical protein HPB48_018652 [Haemaphysalis longicornis]|uniref:Uncharacterized protein n=1 Tax=Haemaphysalis longicornis TaxID=44386 RepID=A0A9J6GFX5_HAELO|nr:hypothetical protein HPB48_018652 [Haemaphysalis longicornis]
MREKERERLKKETKKTKEKCRSSRSASRVPRAVRELRRPKQLCAEEKVLRRQVRLRRPLGREGVRALHAAAAEMLQGGPLHRQGSRLQRRR